MSEQLPSFRVTLTATVPASNPVEAAHVFTRHAGQPGLDKFSVVDAAGESHVVDMGLLVKLGVLKFEEPAPEEASEAPEASEITAA